MIIQMHKNKGVSQDAPFLCNQYENQVAEITVNLPDEYVDAAYFYYMVCKSPNPAVAQFATPILLQTDDVTLLPLNKVKYIVGSSISWTSGEWEFCLLIKSVAMVDGVVGTNGIVAVSEYFRGKIKSGIIDTDTLAEQPVDPNIVILYDNSLAAELLRVAAEDDRLLNEIDRKTSEDTRISNENLRLSAETSRISAENLRVPAESVRIINEDARKSAETIRLSNEATRVNNENSRVSSESTRGTAENARIANEENRVTAENSRLTKETERLNAETDRLSSETDRLSSETTRKANEVIRVSNEDGRATAESGRVTAESNRGTAEVGRVNAESTRVATESGRVVAENSRVDAETTRAAFYGSFSADMADVAAEVGSNKDLPHYDHVQQEYINLDKMWDELRTGKVYTSEFNQYSVSPSSIGTKKDDNMGLTCVPSTNAVKGQNDYEKIGLFSSMDVNAYVDANDNYHVKAIKGDKLFKADGTNGDVYVMSMVGYLKWYSNETVWGISYSDTLHAGFDVLDEAVKPDGTIRPFLLHAKYIAGINPLDSKLASISGVYPEYVAMDHNSQITKFLSKGAQYSGKTSHDDFYAQMMFWLKYANLNQDTIMKGCTYYYYQYVATIAETDVTRIVMANAQAVNLVVGSCVSIGDYGAGAINADRQLAQNYNIANRVKILSIEPLVDDINTAINLDTATPFTTTLTSTITTYPWRSGSCDNVLGQDGSPTNNTSGKEPFIINGIEIMVGGYEILQNLIIYNNNTDVENYRVQVYVCYDCHNYTTSPTANYDLIAKELAETNAAWSYITKIEVDENHPSVMIPTVGGGSSSTGFADGVYTNAPTTGYREWRSFGYLCLGAVCGLRFLVADNGLSGSSWYVLGRLSATGRSRRRAGVN